MDARSSDAAEPAMRRAYRAIEHMIVTLDLAPGAVVTERVLIDHTGLGRTPVREAVQRLAWEGLLEIRPRSGVAVAPLHPADWVRVLEARRGAELVLARDAARYVTPDAALRFRDSGAMMNRAVVSGNVVAFLEADKALDEAMALAADNPFASRLAAPLQTHSRRFWYRFQSESGLEEAAGGHGAIIRAILEGDAQGAEDAAARLMDLLFRHAEDVARR